MKPFLSICLECNARKIKLKAKCNKLPAIGPVMNHASKSVDVIAFKIYR
jgi:hypothetical protein